MSKYIYSTPPQDELRIVSPLEGAGSPQIPSTNMPQTVIYSLFIDPPVANFQTTGGTSVHKLINHTGIRLAFKIKSSNNKDYRMNQVYGFLEPEMAFPLIISRIGGQPRIDKLVVQYKKAVPNLKDAEENFKQGPPIGEITMQLIAQ
ncbi:unnamed protein product [Dracunculus medinensis]|uniref:Major sperm protein n=1 Tax=Dracunculus medinensis TaxID=318479 RepID=A0A0N4U7W0_DRAME|nr:unnamed protein product [Dracunculus medinensis]